MGAVQSDNRHLGILSGFGSEWEHGEPGETVTIVPRTGQIVVLHRIVLNTNGGLVTVRDSAAGVIGTIALDAPEGPFEYQIPLKGNLIVEVGSTSDVTIVHSND